MGARIRFRTRSALRVDAFSTGYTHGALGAALGRIDGRVQAAIHQPSDFLGTSGPLVDGYPALTAVDLDAGEEFTLRVSAGGAVASAALARLLEGDTLSLELGPKGGPFVTCDAIDSFVEDPSGEPLTFADICRMAAGEAEGPMRMRFVTPTSFKRRSTWLALPSPDHVFGEMGPERSRGLAARWAEMGGPPLPLEFTGASIGCTPVEVIPSVVQTHTPVKGRHGNPAPVRAFVGACDYYATDVQARQAMWALGRFAQYVGVGYGRAMGLGWVECERVR